MSHERILSLALASLCAYVFSGADSHEAGLAEEFAAPELRLEIRADHPAPVRVEPFALEDQFGDAHNYTFPKARVSVLLFADKAGSEQVEGWVLPLYDRYQNRIDIDGVADLSAVPSLMRGVVRFFFKRNAKRPIMLDWDGTVTSNFACTAGRANVFVVDTEGIVSFRYAGGADPKSIEAVCLAVDRAVHPVEKRSLPNSPLAGEPAAQSRGDSDSQ